MVSSQTLACVLACASLAAGCASKTDRMADEAPAPVRYAEDSVPAPGMPAELTATEAATIVSGADVGAAPRVTSDSIREDAPSSYTVQRGDTLWGISNLFLKDPWLWPEIWHVNPQLPNPHLIFPGDVLALAYGADGSPQLSVQQGGAARLHPQLRSSPVDGPIATIPYAAIAAFLSRPSLVSEEQLRDAPRVLTFRQDHMVGGTGSEIYVRNLDAPTNARYAVVHIAEPLVDPDDDHVLGYEGVYTATARVLRAGEPSKAILVDTARETLEGDSLIATDSEAPIAFEVRIPQARIDGEIIAVVDDSTLVGTYQIVAINRGTRHGLAPGHVLAVDNAGDVVSDRYSRPGKWYNLGSSFAEKVQLPAERAGTLLIFKTYDRMSYAIIVGAVEPIAVADRIHTP